MLGTRILFAALGAVIGAVCAVTAMKLLQLEGSASVAGGMAGGIAGAFAGRAAAKKKG